MSGETVTAGTLAAALPQARLVGDDRAVTDLVHDSRDVTPGAGFVAIRGATTDGHDHAPAACGAGASLLVVDHDVDSRCPQLIVDDTRACMGELAAIVHGRPAAELKLLGVTGTNGKTTVTHMIEAMVGAGGGIPGIVGTVGAHVGGRVVRLARTTPEATDLHRLLRHMVDRGVTAAALEVSSHALVYGRVDGVVFDVAAFTNLSQDHLDFHGNMEDYFLAKAELFTTTRARHAVVWIDDPAGARLAAMTPLAVTTVGFGPAGAHDVSGEIIGAGSTSTALALHVGAESHRVAIPIAGRFNAANALIAAASATRLGLSIAAIIAGLEKLEVVPGRFESIPNGLGITVVVDYAHTPDAVANAIAAAAEVAAERVIAVVGAAGDRDPEKRAPMGAAAARADLAVITSDNPRSEDPGLIVEQVLAGAGGRSSTVLVEVDRRIAIRRALEAANAGDMVLILGKGHEDYQELATGRIDFDDRVIAAAELSALDRGGR